VTRGSAIAEALHDDGTLPTDSQLAIAIAAAFEIGDDRVSDQDIEYFLDQLVEVAVRALSPAINDPFTAMACVDRLGVSLRSLAGRQLPTPLHYDDQGTLRLVSKTETFRGALDASFNLIRQYGQSSVPVSLRLIETLAVIAEHTSDPQEIEAISNHVRMVEHSAKSHMTEPADIAALNERFARAIRALEAQDDNAF
jgi:uncharacterized membrane protein